MATLFTNIRNDLKLPPMPIAAGELARYLTYTYLNETNAAINGLYSIIPNYAVSSSLGLTPNSDGLHFTAASLVEFGKRYAELFYPIYKNTTGIGLNKDSKIKISVLDHTLLIRTTTFLLQRFVSSMPREWKSRHVWSTMSKITFLFQR